MVGLGRMGMPACARLIAAGFEVHAFDLRSQLRGEVGTRGAHWAPSVAGACTGAEVAVTMLPGGDDVAAVADEVIASLPAGTCWLEMSTASPAVARRLAAGANEAAVRVIDAPIGGGPGAAAEGGLVAYAGGSAEDLSRCRMVLDVLAERVVHVGPAGSGYAVKLLVNALWFGQAVATAEVLTLAQRMGLDLDRVRGALLGSAASSRLLAADAPALLEGDDLPNFPLARCCEELCTVLALGSELRVPLDLIAVVSELHQRALDHYGDVDGELLGARWVAERAGVQLGRGACAPPASPRPAT